MSRLSLANFRSPAPLACFLLTAAVGLAVDLWTKQYAFAKLAPHGVVELNGVIRIAPADGPMIIHRFLPGWLHFEAMANQGAVFGIGQGQWKLFIVVSVAAILFILYLFTTSGAARFYQFILGLLLAGVVGNMYDRLTFGFVRDMIHIFPGKTIWGRAIFPWIFNVADAMLCVGVALIFLYSLRGPGKEKEAPEATTAKSGGVVG